MAVKTDEERLELYQNALDGIAGGAQSWTVLGRQFVLPDLKALEGIVERLRLRIERTARGGMRVRLGRPT
jgi:hypothetical protein